MTAGRVNFIGLGPGDPELITVKGKRIIEAADVIIYNQLFERSILDWAKSGCEIIEIGPRNDPDSLCELEIASLMAQKALAGKLVARLEMGDPFLFSHSPEEFLALPAEIEVEVVSGISAAQAAAATGIPLTIRGCSSSVGFFIFGLNKTMIEWAKIADGLKTLVFFRGLEHLDLICKKLIEHGRTASTPLALIQWASLPGQIVIKGTLGDIKTKLKSINLKAPTIIIVGEVVNLQMRPGRSEKPLAGKRVLVTRAKEQAHKISALLRDRGALPLELPVIKIQACQATEIFDQALLDLSRFDWLIFTSVNSVRFFKAKLAAEEIEQDTLDKLKIIVVGSKTARKVKELGFQIHVAPKEFRAEGIIDELRKINIEGQRFLLPRALKARELLPQAIEELGGEVVVAPLYETVPAVSMAVAIKAALTAKEVDVITFTSGSTIENFLLLIENDYSLLRDVKIAVIGPIAASVARQNNLEVDIIPAVATMEGLVDALENFYQ